MQDSTKQMLETIVQEAAYTASYTGRSHFSSQVMQAMADVNRADFVPEIDCQRAYANGPLSIGFGQTISQPFIVALMTDLLDLNPEHQVLEIGTGSGYQTAILSKLAERVFTLERIEALAKEAEGRLTRLGYCNISCQQANGYSGWPDYAPFDRILVTAAAPVIPPALIEQLKPGGRLVLPLGAPHHYQELMVISKDDKGITETSPVLGVSFVPLVND